MRWTPGGRSRNVEDLRGRRGLPIGAGMGVGGTIIVLILGLLFGGDIFSGGGGAGAPTTATETGAIEETPEERRLVEFVSFVLDDAQRVWSEVIPRYGGQYREAKLVLFRDYVQSGCGTGQSAMGPFYCPLDEKIYIDLGFYDALQKRFGAPGDFAQAYVIAHEIGHHVQNVTGTASEVRQMQESRPSQANALSVRLELQADCYAGVWGNSTSQRQILERGDVEEALSAAAAIGDDRIQAQSGGGIQPESFTHGTSEQRVRWFRRGLESGDPRTCDTFAGAI
ncbi:MAG TPA: neutral zinc metallopeptidase [Gemmatimonadaceae bacterium]|nr:neutral zinc metallopeptidase [Gemmatimonadaceae bacterium]